MNLSTLEKTTTIDRIEETIRTRFAEGVEPTPEIRHFIESTFGALSASALAEWLAQEGGEKEVLVDLLFSADDSLQCGIEPLLGPEGLCRAERDALCARLEQNPIRAAVRIDGEDPLNLFLPAEMVEGFLTRLNLHRFVDAALFAAVMDRYPEKEALAVRTRLREARLSAADSETKALSRFFSARSPDRESFWPLLNSLIGFLESMAGGGDLFSALAARKRSCLRHLREAAGLEKTMARHNIETIMMGGTRIPCVDNGALVEEIVSVDDLSTILFGGIPPGPNGGPTLDLGEVSSREDLDRLVRFFMS
ncbi:MAG: hypothetical protein K9L59_20170 [Desulfobacterales bacterium]|nr:hypothetical protein [Desulfobacterales bacterium]